MVKGLLLLGCLSLWYNLAFAVAPTQIRSAVSPDFPDGLHSKYLNYVADSLGFQLKILPMSYSRRLRALNAGELDILVSLQRVNNEALPAIFYIQPAYQELASTFFVRQGEAEKLSSYADLSAMRIAVTGKVSYFSAFDQEQKLAKVEVDSLHQKIKLLLNHRVDAFIHNQDSTVLSLKSMQLTGLVVAAEFQPKQKRQYYFAIGTQSVLYSQRQRLQAVIKKAVKQGVFREIRRQHYLELANKSLQKSGSQSVLSHY